MAASSPHPSVPTTKPPVNLRKLALVLILLAGMGLFFALDLGRFFSLRVVQDSQAALLAARAQHPVGTSLLYVAVYVVVTALSLPGAAILTLAGGVLFGLVWGTLLVSVASTIGATLAMLAARYLLRDAVQARFGHKLAALNQGVERDGAFYLFTLRLIPALPFFVLNLLMGLTPMKTWTYAWVSQLGMLAPTVVFVNAGTQLARISAPADVLSPQLLGSFVLLGLLPLIVRQLLAVLKRRKVYARWRGVRPRHFDRNLVVIGAGAGGLVSAYLAAAVKARVTLVEARDMGGDCLNTGCVPSKALIRSATLAHQMRHASRYGLTDTVPEVDFKAVMQRIQDVIRTIAPHDSVERYTDLGVEVLQGHATLVNPWTVAVALKNGETQSLTTRAIVIATGARPIIPPLPGLDDVGCLTSETLWEAFAKLDHLPRRLAILGGGPIGCELAQSLQRLGAQVTLIEAAPRLLGQEDDEACALVQAALASDGVQVLTAHRALRCEREGDEKYLVVDHAGTEHRIAFDALICAVGREARLTGFGLEALGITGDRCLETNDCLQTAYPHIYAVGDVTGPLQLTHAAAHQAWYAVVNALFGEFRTFKVDARVMPRTTFTDPEVARVGLNEREAREQAVPVEVTTYPLAELDRAIADSDTRGFVKVLTVPGKDRILGVTIVGSHAGEQLAEFVLAMKHGLGLNHILGTVHAYPTHAEANKAAAGAWRRAHAPQRLLAWAARYHRWKRR